ncbi:MAG: transposon-transfer assisting family protein [Bacillota bacterium]
MIKFTVEESNLICMYNTGTRVGTLTALRMFLPFIDDPDMRAIADSTAAKLDGMTDAEFAAVAFGPVHPDADDEHGAAEMRTTIIVLISDKQRGTDVNCF